jgi:hypothetical protein
MLLPLSIAFGLLVGFALGLTGGGGSIFAVPLLVYGLAVTPREAVGVSLAAVGATSLVGSTERLRAAEVELGVGLLFALAGMLGAPVGTWVNGYVPEWLLLTLFAGLMIIVAVRMWVNASQHRAGTPMRGEGELNPTQVPSDPTPAAPPQSPNVRRWLLLGLAGLVTGVLSGIFGVGGGFLIVPALVLVGGLEIHRATATSLLVIALISAAGVAAYLNAGRPLALDLTALFVVGGVGGMWLGVLVGRRLSGPHLQRVFAVAMIAVALFIVGKNIL